MARGMYKTMDPHEIQKRFSTERDSFYKLSESTFRFEDFQPFLDKLPLREKDLLEMYYRANKKQKEIAKFFGVTQGAVSHRIARARKRLAFLRDMPKLSSDIKDLLGSHFEEFDIEVIQCMVDTTCQSRTAEMLNDKYRLRGRNRMTQVKVRHKFDRSLQRLSQLRKSFLELTVCYELLSYIKSNLYMMHEVVLPHFDRGFRVRYHKVF